MPHSLQKSALSCLEDMSSRLRARQHPLPMEGTSCHYAAILNRQHTVIAASFNKASTRSAGRGSSRFTRHAEMDVLKRLGDLTKLEGCTLVVTRFNTKADIVGSRPCCECQTKLARVMRKYGLRAVLYT